MQARIGRLVCNLLFLDTFGRHRDIALACHTKYLFNPA